MCYEKIKIKIKITTYSIDVRYLLSTWRYILQVKIVMSLKTSCRTNILNIMNTWLYKTKQPDRYSLLEVTIVMTLEADVIAMKAWSGNGSIDHESDGKDCLASPKQEKCSETFMPSAGNITQQTRLLTTSYGRSGDFLLCHVGDKFTTLKCSITCVRWSKIRVFWGKIAIRRM